jgi:hypothetical protein
MEVTMHHALHFAVAEEMQMRLAGRGELIRDTACGGAHHLPLFVGTIKGRENHMCDVDLLIITENQVRIIVEIEESGFLPTKICGKFLQSAIATHFIHDSQAGSAMQYSNHVLFVQVLDGLKCLKQGTRKDSQGELIEQKVRSMLPFKGSGITDYRLFFVQGVYDYSGLSAVGAVVSNALT